MGQKMTAKTIRVQGTNKCPIQVRQWIPEGKPVALLHILHGMGEHSLRYEDFARWLNDKGIGVWAHDHRQHGYSVGHHVYGVFDQNDSWEAMVKDALEVQKSLRDQYPDLPQFILGHSMGSLVTRSLLQNHTLAFSGAIIMGTPSTNKILLKGGQVLGSVLSRLKGIKESPLMDQLSVGAYNKTIKNPRTPFDWLSYDLVNVDNYSNDPMCGYVYNPAFYCELAKGSLDANDDHKMSRFPKIPLLMISGDEDPAGNFGAGVLGVASIYRLKGVRVKEKLMKHMRHEVLNEYHKTQTYEAVYGFIEKHL